MLKAMESLLTLQALDLFLYDHDQSSFHLATQCPYLSPTRPNLCNTHCKALRYGDFCVIFCFEKQRLESAAYRKSMRTFHVLACMFDQFLTGFYKPNDTCRRIEQLNDPRSSNRTVGVQSQ